jgi:hypothetical protein
MRFIYRRIVEIAFLLAAGMPVGAAWATDDGGVIVAADPAIASMMKASSSESLPPPSPPRADSASNGRTTGFSAVLARINRSDDSHVEASEDDFARLFDEIYASSSAGRRRVATFSLDSSVSAGIADVAGSFSLDDQRLGGFEVLAGVRFFDTTFDFKFARASPAVALGRTKAFEYLADALIGARYTVELSDHWAIVLRADGGFGETDTNYNASAALKYRSGNGTWLIGYQYMDTRFNSGGKSVDLSTLGPVIGYTLRF